MDRIPEPLRCHDCGEIIFQGQEWSEYGEWEDTHELPWHTACWEKREAERVEERKKHGDWLKSLEARPWESLTFEEASFLSMHKCSMDLINVICADEVFPGGK